MASQQQHKSAFSTFEVVQWDGAPTLHGEPVPAALRRAFIESHRVLIKDGVVLALRKVWPHTLLAAAVVGQIAGIVASRLFDRSAAPSLSLSVLAAWRPAVTPVTVAVTVGTALSFVAALWRTSVNGWQQAFDRISRGDLSDESAAKRFATPTSVCFLLVHRPLPTTATLSAATPPPPPRIVGMACLTEADHANEIAEDILRPFGAGEGLVTRVGVLPEFHGCGGGSQLICALIAEARRRGLHRLKLATSTIQVPAMKLYARYGFLVTESEAVFASLGVFKLSLVAQL